MQTCFTWGLKHQLNQLKNSFLCKFKLHHYSKSSNNTHWQVPAIWIKVSVSIFLSWRFKIKWHCSFFPISWRRVCLSTGLAVRSSPFWWDKQQFCLKMSLRYLQRNNLITHTTPKCWIWAVIKQYPIKLGLTKGKLLLPPWQKWSAISTEIVCFFISQEIPLQDSSSSIKCGSVTYIRGRA